jgi:hypothetical protein
LARFKELLSVVNFRQVLHLLHQVRIGFIIPLLKFNPLLHFLQSLAEHLGKLDRQVSHLVLEVIDFVILLLDLLLVIPFGILMQLFALF